tara:strand:+ start:776 stop:1870 length:1095 start_codon:yes stop_codon:yes gene_type:complete
MENIKNQNKIYYLESLRGIAALTVALFHFRNSSNSILISNEFVQNGWVMVDFFFVLSGFVISYNYFEKLSSLKNLLNFQIRRFLRLYPLHLFTLLLMLGLEILQFLKEFFSGDIGQAAAFANNNLLAFLNNFLLTHALFEKELTFNNPSWSISTEFFTYLLFGILIVFLKKFIKLFLAVSFLIVIFSGYYIFEELNITNQFSIFRCFHSFFLGFIAFYFFKYYKIYIKNWIVYIIFFLTIISIHQLKNIPPIFLPFIFFTLIFVLVSSNENFIKKILNLKILIFFGKISYGIYMIHYFIWVIFEQIIKIITKPIDNSTFLLDPIIGTFVVILGLTIIIFLSNFLYNNIEMKFNSYKNNFKINNY